MQFHQRIVAFDLVRFTAGHVESQRIALGVRAEMDFGREAATRAAERFLILIPPFTPAACWCALTMVASMACSLSAGGPRLAKVSNAASHTPSLLQRVKRTKTEFQLPYRSGMSRHGAPVRRTQRIPLTVRRLSGIGGPRSPRSGSSGSRMRHSASEPSKTPRDDFIALGRESIYLRRAPCPFLGSFCQVIVIVQDAHLLSRRLKETTADQFFRAISLGTGTATEPLEGWPRIKSGSVLSL